MLFKGNGLNCKSKETKKNHDVLEKQYLDLKQKRTGFPTGAETGETWVYTWGECMGDLKECS